jgi:hypothetical protein
LEAIDLYHAVCCPRGFVKVNRYALGLQNALRAELDALKVCHPENWREELRAEFEKAADSFERGDSVYCAEGGNRLIRILYSEL